MVKCPVCGQEIRYITAPASASMPPAESNGIIAVDTQLEELVKETGRIVRGYRPHKCAKKQEETRRC